MDMKSESKATLQLYGIDEQPTQVFGQQCLVARRLVERGVRFVELLCRNVGADRWDQHGDLRNGHSNNAKAVDKPIAGLLKDLKSRGLLDSTLVVWAGEFGRPPAAQGNGRDHHAAAHTVWMAGGGVKAGTIYGATDEIGYRAVQDPVPVRDIHATILHLLGLNHRQLSVLHNGRRERLTDFAGQVIETIV